jgi:hypothetical protein
MLLPRWGEIDALIGEVVLDHCRIALGRRAIAAGPWSDNFDRLSGAQAASSVDERLDTVTNRKASPPSG